MGRYGGFRVGEPLIFNNWDQVKSPSSPNSEPLNVKAIEYSSLKGIWNLNSTTQFPRVTSITLPEEPFQVTAGTINYDTAASFSLAYPADIQAGDLLLVVGLVQSATIYGTITGWNNVASSGTYRTLSSLVATGTETGTVTVTKTGTASSVTVMYRIRITGYSPQWERGADPGFVANPTVSLTPPVGAYTRAIHLITYMDNGALTMSSLDSQYTQLQTRTTTYGLVAGYIDTTKNGRINTTATSSSGGNTMSTDVIIVYI